MAAGGPAQTQVQSPEYRYPHLSAPRWQYYQQHPEEFQQLLESRPLVSHELVPGTMLAPGQQPVIETGLSPLAWAVIQYRKDLIVGLWNDLEPADNNITINLKDSSWKQNLP